MWEGQALPHDTKFGNSRCEIVGRRVIFILSLIHGLRWSGLIKAEPGHGFIEVYVMYVNKPREINSLLYSVLWISHETLWHLIKTFIWAHLDDTHIKMG